MSILKYKVKNINQIGGSDKVTFKFIRSINELNQQEIKEIIDSHKKCFGNNFQTYYDICLLKFNGEIIAYCSISLYENNNLFIWSVCKTIKGQKYKGACKRLIAEVANYCKNTYAINYTELFLYVRISGEDYFGNSGKNMSAIKCYESNNFKFINLDEITFSINHNGRKENFTTMKLDLENVKNPESFNIMRIFKINELILFNDKENINKYKFYKSTKNKEIYVAEVNPTDYNKLKDIPIYIRKPLAQ